MIIEKFNFFNDGSPYLVNSQKLGGGGMACSNEGPNLNRLIHHLSLMRRTAIEED